MGWEGNPGRSIKSDGGLGGWSGWPQGAQPWGGNSRKEGRWVEGDSLPDYSSSATLPDYSSSATLTDSRGCWPELNHSGQKSLVLWLRIMHLRAQNDTDHCST